LAKASARRIATAGLARVLAELLVICECVSLSG
jgi:hypothetical protein